MGEEDSRGGSRGRRWREIGKKGGERKLQEVRGEDGRELWESTV